MIKIAFSNKSLYRWAKSIPILRSLTVFDLSALNTLTDNDLYDRIFQDINLNNDTYKTTYSGRFHDVDRHAIANHLSAQSHIALHDIAVSSGVTSLELFEQLRTPSRNLEFYISDRYSRCYAKKGFATHIYDAHQNHLQSYFLGLVADRKAPAKAFLSRVLYTVLAPFIPQSVEGDPDLQQVLLYHVDVVQNIHSGRLKEIDYDVLSTSLSDKFTYVRAMNILNRQYFSEQLLSKAIRNIATSMKEDAILQVGRTHDGINDVSFFRKQGPLLRWVEDINAGSEIKEIILPMKDEG